MLSEKDLWGWGVIFLSSISLIATTVGGHTNCSDGDVRLEGGSNPAAGRLEVCANQVWGTVCSGYYWSTSDSNVVCRQLGYQFFGKAKIQSILLQSYFITTAIKNSLTNLILVCV